MGIQDLQIFLESNAVEGGSVSVDLLRIARNATQRQNQINNRNKRFNVGNKLKLVLDAECCLDRLYGGYFSDWACGGQWNRTVQFLSLLIHAIESGNIDLAVIFNGALEQQRMSEWKAEQSKIRQRMNMVLKHINMKGTPPPKVWWCPPTCLRTVVRMALRHLNTQVLCSMDDHHQEVIAYCRENMYHGIIADDAEYAAFDPPRYFSSENLKLTYKGSLETKEFMVSEAAKQLGHTQEQVCILAALLGNCLLPDSELNDVYTKMGLTFTPSRPTSEQFVKAVAEYVRSLPSISNMDALVQKVFGSTDDKRATALRQSIQYYLNGTADGFLKYRTATTRRPDHQNMNKKKNSQTNNIANHTGANKSEENDLDTSGFASETTEREQKSREDYKLATANAVISSAPEIVIEADIENLSIRPPSAVNGSCVSGAPVGLSVGGSSSASSSSATSPRHQQSGDTATPATTSRPRVSVEVMRTATERHQKGLMSPLIYHALLSGEVRLPCVMEDEQHREFPPAHLIYRPVRQRVYAVLFNLHHLCYLANKARQEASAGSGDAVPVHAQAPEVVVREWVWTRVNQYQRADTVRAEQLGWAVPTIQRLWFGGTVDDKRRRLRAFLTCLDSDSSLMLNPSYVPQHMLILACVLRYIMSYRNKCILRKQELDAFIAQAFSPELMNSQYLQELMLPLVTSRGVQLAALFMQGVETALLANDACGAPIPWLMSCPWLYFDGKLFHHTLARAAVVKNLLELCENHIERVVKVERMRKAILEGLDYQFAKQPLPSLRAADCGVPRTSGMPPPNCLPPLALPSSRGLAGRRPLPARGGQLQVAGVVVGQWGANYGLAAAAAQQQHYGGRAPQHGVVGNAGRGRGRYVPQHPAYHHPALGVTGMNKGGKGPTWPAARKNFNNKKKPSGDKKKRGGVRGLTVQLQSGETVSAAELKGLARDDGDKPTDAAASEHKGQGDGPIKTTD